METSSKMRFVALELNCYKMADKSKEHFTN